MAFFERPTTEKLLELHVSRLRKLEERDSERILKRYKEIRAELNDRLLTFRRDSFSAQQARGVLAQVQSAIDAMSNSVFDQVKESALDMLGLGVDQLVDEINFFDEYFTGAVVPINVDLLAIASDASELLINRYQSSVERYSEDLRGAIERNLTNGIIIGQPIDTLLQNVGSFFLGEEWKLRRVARTELHNVHSMSKLAALNGLAQTQDGLMKRLYHPMDSRTAKDSIALRKLDPALPINEPFKFKWNGQMRIFQAPPDRPNDRAILVPFRKGWDKS